MCPIKVSARSKQKTCSVGRAGIGFPQAIVEKTGWLVGDKIEVAFIPDVKCILLSNATESEDAFTLGYANARSKTGGRISCQAFVRNYLQALVALPRRNIVPVLLERSDWRVALLLEQINWQTGEFSKAGWENAPRDAIGVYELLGKGGAVLRIGEGRIRDRIKAHLDDPARFLPTVKMFRFVTLTDKTDTELLEKILIAQYEAETGVLPPFNDIRA